MPQYTLRTSDDLPICAGCGTQYPADNPPPSNCRICDDPRQFVPPSGQSWTSLRQLREQGHKNVFEPCAHNSSVVEIWTEPKVGIGQSARLIRTERGNVLWDLVAYLDENTVEEIEERGGLVGVVISHPHFYTTWADWSATFQCPVYTAAPDEGWLNRVDAPDTLHKFLTQPVTSLPVPGLTALICGGHFPGSMILHADATVTGVPSIFVADTIFSVASSHNPTDHYFPGRTQTYSFLWSIPNMVPLPPDDIHRIWRLLRSYEFKASYGVMAKATNVFEREGDKVGLKERLLESAKQSVRMMGYREHPLLDDTLEMVVVGESRDKSDAALFKEVLRPTQSPA